MEDLDTLRNWKQPTVASPQNSRLTYSDALYAKRLSMHTTKRN